MNLDFLDYTEKLESRLNTFSSSEEERSNFFEEIF